MARIRDLVVDCRHPASLARFWAAVLDNYVVAPYDEAELARLRTLGIYDTEDDPSVVIEPASGTGPRVFFQIVPEPKIAKNRVHLDLTSADVPAEVERLTSLGARVLAERQRFVTLADPEGNEFDLTPSWPPRGRRVLADRIRRY